MLPAENSYGVLKRLLFVGEALRAASPRRVLDIGCGTGADLTLPLAHEFQGVHFVGVDTDTASIEHAKHINTLSNLEYVTAPPPGESFDVIIASEVIEHVEDPDAFLSDLRSRLTRHGRLVLTLPNGYGAFELSEFLRSVFTLCRLYDPSRRAAVADYTPSAVNNLAAYTLAVSPHVNFFSYAAIAQLIRKNGFMIERYLARTVFCGFGFDHILGRSKRLLALNTRLADLLPAAASSDWMFVLKPEKPVKAALYRRGIYAKLRRTLNEKAARVTAGG